MAVSPEAAETAPATAWTVERALRWSLVRKCLPVTASSMSSAALMAEATAPVAEATAVTAVATVVTMAVVVTAAASPATRAGRAATAAPAVATAATAKTMAMPMSRRRSSREKCPVGSTLMIGLVENPWYLLKTLAVSRLVKRPWVGS